MRRMKFDRLVYIFKKNFVTFLIALLLISTVIRFWRLDAPRDYVFDEVYHAFTAKMYLLNRYEAWVWWESPPDGVAYEWTHPPLAKILMALGIQLVGGPGDLPTKVSDPTKTLTTEEQNAEKVSTKILATHSAGWRVFSAFFGVLATYAVYLLTSSLFSNRNIGLLAAFIYTFDLLPFVQSRTAMNDIFAVTFILFGFYFFTKRAPVNGLHQLYNPRLSLLNWLLSGIFIGCAIASKWTSFFSLGILALYHGFTLIHASFQLGTLKSGVRHFFAYLIFDIGKALAFFVVLPFTIYLLSYWQLFTVPIYDYKGNSLKEFVQNHTTSAPTKNDEKLFTWMYTIEPYFADRLYIWWGVQKQMWWYHTHLDATHNYTSKWWTWPLNIRPVWFYVQYCGSADNPKKANCKTSLDFWSTDRTYADIYTMGNPFIHWMILPVFLGLFWNYCKQYRTWLWSLVPAITIAQVLWLASYKRKSLTEPLVTYIWDQMSGVVPALMLYFFFMILLLTFVQLLYSSKDNPDKKGLISVFFLMMAFSGFLLPWARSPRIMFFYHFLPPVMFFYPLLAFSIYLIWEKYSGLRKYTIAYVVLIPLSFFYFYPHVSAVLVPELVRNQWYWLSSWK